MGENVQVVYHKRKQEDGFQNRFGRDAAKTARRFHESIPGYAVTPLAELPELSKRLGVAGIYVKDESKRFGLNAFKGLGGSYCIGRYIGERLGIAPEELSYERITGDEVKEQLGTITFVTATDGNHGRGIAWTAQMLGQKAVVFMPKGSSQERLEHIRHLGAQASITDWNYDRTVEYAAECEKTHGWVLVQDTAWEGYETIPGWIMEGYTTMAAEAVEQLGQIKPTHVFLQAGVGAMSGAVAGFLADYYQGEEQPAVIIVEPDQADCVFRTARADDGKLHTVDGDLSTIMAGLACGVPCTTGWEHLSRCADYFASIPDAMAAKGMRVLGNPVGEDPRIVSGESGASAFGYFCQLMERDDLKEMREKMGLSKESRVLFFSTEGDTDRENYRRIVWDGAYPNI